MQPTQNDNQNDHVWPMLCHLSAVIAVMFPFGHVLAPLLIWLAKRDENPAVDIHGRASLNFQLTITFVFAMATLLVAVCFVIAVVSGFAATGDKGSGTAVAIFAGNIGVIIMLGVVFGFIGILNIALVGLNSIRAYDGKAPVYWPLIRFVH
jgi:uncharacterized Tic20 family protein